MLCFVTKALDQIRSFIDGKRAVERDPGLGVQLMTDPARAYMADATNPLNVIAGVAKFRNQAGIDAVEDAKKDGARGIEEHSENEDCDRERDDWIDDRVAQFHGARSCSDREARETIDARVMTIRYERRAVNLVSGAHANLSGGLVGDESNDARRCDSTESADRLRVHNSLNGFVSDRNRAQENDEHDRDTGEILDPAVAVSETIGRRAAAHDESDREWNRRAGVGGVVNHVGEQADAARQNDDAELDHGGDSQHEKRQFQRIEAAHARGERRIDDAVRVMVPRRRIVLAGK